MPATIARRTAEIHLDPIAVRSSRCLIDASRTPAWAVPSLSIGRRADRASIRPGWSRCRKDALVVSAEQFCWVPILTSALVRNQRHPASDILHLSAEFGNPDDVRCQIVARFMPEHIALNFERPSKTFASSRADEHDDADLASIAVERPTQRFSVTRDHLVMQGTSRVAAPASAQQRTGAADQKRLVSLETLFQRRFARRETLRLVRLQHRAAIRIDH